jgi:hypothetical protein
MGGGRHKAPGYDCGDEEVLYFHFASFPGLAEETFVRLRRT